MHKTAFFTNKDLYKYVVIPFGLYYAIEIFQRLTKLIFFFILFMSQ